MARIAEPIIASLEQKHELVTMSRSLKMESRYVQRSRVILLSLEGQSMDSIIQAT